VLQALQMLLYLRLGNMSIGRGGIKTKPWGKQLLLRQKVPEAGQEMRPAFRASPILRDTFGEGAHEWREHDAFACLPCQCAKPRP
jgi:hypothetical protein